jgi:hypothetical protein
MEFTNVKGHANFFFPDPQVKFEGDFIPNSFDDMAVLFRKVKAQGGIISLNHIRLGCGWLYGYEGFPFDMFEIWNGPMEDHNMQAIALWHQFLCKGKKIPAVGGSDAHQYGLGSSFGFPCNFVTVLGRSVKTILAALLAGHNCIGCSPNGPYLDVSIENAIAGDTILYHQGLEGKVLVSRASKGDFLKIITEAGIAETYIVPFNGTFSVPFDIKRTGFCRLELYRSFNGSPTLVALSNPIYIV